MRTLYLDVTRGVTVEALLAALLDAGAELPRLAADLEPIVGDVGLRAELRPPHGSVVWSVPSSSPPAIREMVSALRRSAWHGALRAHAARILMALHGPEIHDPQAGVLVLALLLAVGQLGVTGIRLSPVPIDMSTLPPWAARWLTGWNVVHQTGAICDPVALWALRALGAHSGSFPSMRIICAGQGLLDSHGGVRAWIGSPIEATLPGTVAVFETALPIGWEGDLERVRTACFEAGAEEVFVHPPDSRGGIRISLRCDPGHEHALKDCLLEGIGVAGLRTTWVNRESLIQERLTVPTPGGAIRLAVHREGGAPVRLVPELCDALQVARQTGLSVRSIMRLAVDEALHRAALVG